jgi:hypothetical protein
MGASALEPNYLQSENTILYHKTWSAEIINNAAKTAAFTYSLPANMLRVGDSLKIEVMGVVTTVGTGSVIMTVDFGATTVSSLSMGASDITAYQSCYKIIVPTSLTTQISTRVSDSGFSQITARTAPAEDLSGPVDITFNLDNPDVTTGSRILLAKVELRRAAG